LLKWQRKKREYTLISLRGEGGEKKGVREEGEQESHAAPQAVPEKMHGGVIRKTAAGKKRKRAFPQGGKNHPLNPQKNGPNKKKRCVRERLVQLQKDFMGRVHE